jgi:thiosulfate/3-mercaptopyruvate sulfurtransferase
MLHVLDKPVAVLDGGLAAWAGALESGPSRPLPVAPFEPVPWPEGAVASLEEIEAHAAADRGITLLDARAGARYRAEVDVDPRPGHIPGAVSAELAGNLADDDRFLPPGVLEQRYRSLGAVGADVVVSCGSGVTACHDALAMVRAGLPLPRLYVGSYSQWIADPSRPVVAGASPRV